ncbi:MAG: FTR1 family protein, partial [Anaerolineae bacterium]|nr:FTR1 family protein [Anaerolineae bacterium]
MFPSFVLALREGLEAALIIGIVFGALRKMQRTEFVRAVWFGVGSAAVVSVLGALLLNALGASFVGDAEKIFEGTTMFAAAAVLTWMIFWIQRQARTLQNELASDVRQAAQNSGAQALFALSFFAVVREGIELALFLTAAAITSTAAQTLFGAAFGLAASALLGWSLFASTARLNLRRFFQVTSVLLIVFAAGLVAHGIHEFNEVGWIPSLVEHIWDVNHLLDENGSLGV